MACFNFSSWQFGPLPKFSKFVNIVLFHRNHQVGVSSIKIDFIGAVNQDFVKNIANYAFSHNIQQLMAICCPKNHHKFPPYPFTSQPLKHFTFRSFPSSPCATPNTPWDFPSLTTLHFIHIALCDDNIEKSIDIFVGLVSKSITILVCT
uniref:Uncharacterized protein n=1 Tax=Lactuca sativa TaxID=4236 RepID=A0A9R1WBS8_LACSA|nr:hypothetical protein LSAT_V11C300111560 [Lactuca sativa]